MHPLYCTGGGNSGYPLVFERALLADDSRANLLVKQRFESSGDNEINITLKKNDFWKVDSIECPGTATTKPL